MRAAAHMESSQAQENPFAAERIGSIPFRFPAGVTWQTLLDRLGEQKYCAAIVGHRGSGKTALLEQLAPHLEALGFSPRLFRLSAETSMREKERLPDSFRKIVSPGFILLDGADQLSTRLWLPVRTAASQAAGFIVVVHRTSRLPTLFECEPSADLLEDIVHDLTGGTLPGGEAQNLFARHHGDLRACLRELHDRWDGSV